MNYYICDLPLHYPINYEYDNFTLIEDIVSIGLVFLFVSGFILSSAYCYQNIQGIHHMESTEQSIIEDDDSESTSSSYSESSSESGSESSDDYQTIHQSIHQSNQQCKQLRKELRKELLMIREQLTLHSTILRRFMERTQSPTSSTSPETSTIASTTTTSSTSSTSTSSTTTPRSTTSFGTNHSQEATHSSNSIDIEGLTTQFNSIMDHAMNEFHGLNNRINPRGATTEGLHHRRTCLTKIRNELISELKAALIHFNCSWDTVRSLEPNIDRMKLEWMMELSNHMSELGNQVDYLWKIKSTNRMKFLTMAYGNPVEKLHTAMTSLIQNQYETILSTDQMVHIDEIVGIRLNLYYVRDLFMAFDCESFVRNNVESGDVIEDEIVD